jgi:hypothetical protein
LQLYLREFRQIQELCLFTLELGVERPYLMKTRGRTHIKPE